MNALTLTLIRLAFLAVLWLFVIAAVGVVRTDLFGTLVGAPAAAAGREAAQAPARPPQPARAATAAAAADARPRSSCWSRRARWPGTTPRPGRPADHHRPRG